MAGVVEISETYPIPKPALWEYVEDWSDLADVMAGIASYEGLPDTPLRAGETITVRVRLFGLPFAQDWTIEVVEADEVRGIVRSREKGGAVKSWNHLITIAEAPGGSSWTDRIEIDAGVLTGLYCAFARWMYGTRHKRRLAAITAA